MIFFKAGAGAGTEARTGKGAGAGAGAEARTGKGTGAGAGAEFLRVQPALSSFL